MPTTKLLRVEFDEKTMQYDSQWQEIFLKMKLEMSRTKKTV